MQTQRIENVMVINPTAYDPQCRDMPYKCSACEDGVNSVTHFLNGDNICNDCKSEYLRLSGGEFAEDYIYRNQKKYYEDWWFDNLPSAEKMYIIQRAYIEKAQFEINANVEAEYSLVADKIEFCVEQDDFLSYVERCLT